MNRRNENYGQRSQRPSQGSQEPYRPSGRGPMYDDEQELRNEERSRYEAQFRQGNERSYGALRGSYEDYEAGRGMSSRGGQGGEAFGYGDYESERQPGYGYGGYARGAYEGSYGAGNEGFGQQHGGIHGRSDYGPSAGYPREGYPGRYDTAGYDETQGYAGNPRPMPSNASGYSQSGGYGQRSGMYSQSGYGQENQAPSMPGYAGTFGGGRQSQGGRTQYGSGQSGFGQDNDFGPRGMGSYGASGEASRQRSFSGRGPKGYTRSDERLKEDICERLTEDPRIDASDVSIEVREGKVTLNGQVDARWMKHEIEDLVDRCAGVKDIDNRLGIAASRGAGLSGGSASGGSSLSSSGGGSSANYSSSEGDSLVTGGSARTGVSSTNPASTKKN